MTKEEDKLLTQLQRSREGCPDNQNPPTQLLDLDEYEPNAELVVENLELRKQILHLLRQVGTVGKCKGCGTEIFWVEHRNKKKCPYDESGLSHFATCPQANKFRRGA